MAPGCAAACRPARSPPTSTDAVGRVDPHQGGDALGAAAARARSRTSPRSGRREQAGDDGVLRRRGVAGIPATGRSTARRRRARTARRTAPARARARARTRSRTCPVSTTGTGAGAGSQSTASPIGCPCSLRAASREQLPRRPRCPGPPRRTTSRAARARSAGRRGRGSRGSRRAPRARAATSRIGGWSQGHVAAALRRVARRGDLHAERREQLVGERRRRTSVSRDRLLADRVDARPRRSARPCPAIASIPTTAGVPDRNRRMPGDGRRSPAPSGTGRSAPIQPWIGWVSVVEVPRGDVAERRRARARR